MGWLSTKLQPGNFTNDENNTSKIYVNTKDMGKNRTIKGYLDNIQDIYKMEVLADM